MSMKTIVKYAGKIQKGVGVASALAVNPLEFVLDRVIAVIVTALIPIPFIGEIVVACKREVAYILASLVVTNVIVVFMALCLIFNPLGFITQLASLLSGGTAAIPIAGLEGYIEPGFSDVDIPSKDPFGGNGTENSIMTETFHDPGYYAMFGMVHEGIDLVPSQHYYDTNKAYAIAKQVVMFATIAGTARDYVDSYGALTVDITNKQGTLLVEYKHLKQFIMSDGAVHAGQVVGVMGATGFAFGEHLHYQIEVNQNGSWVPVDPTGYIQ